MEGNDVSGTDTSDLRSDNRGKLGKSYQPAGTHKISIMEQPRIYCKR